MRAVAGEIRYQQPRLCYRQPGAPQRGFAGAQPEIGTGEALIFDIGAEYGLTKYDHHQKNKTPDDYRPIEDGTWIDNDGKESPILYCGFGKLWRDFGHLLCKDPRAFEAVDKKIVLPIDKADNGIEGNLISCAISSFNPTWEEEQTHENEASHFWQAEKIAEQILTRIIKTANATYNAEEEVSNAEVVDENILVMDKYVPWQDYMDSRPKLLFVVFPHKRGGYAIQKVPLTRGSFAGRCQFPEKWLGNPPKELGMTFCHTGNFLACCTTKEEAVNAARIAIKEWEKANHSSAL